MGRSWGYDSAGIWVDYGCRADFALRGDGVPPPQPQVRPEEAMRACKNTAGQRLPAVPLAFISVYRGSDTASGKYMINFNAKPPSGPPSSGFCIVTKGGNVERFQFDPPIGGGGNTNPGGGTSAQDAMRTCKNTASDRLPGVPLAFIRVDRGTDTASGSYMINFNAQPPTGPRSSGFCIISRNGRVQDFQFDRNPGGGGNNFGRVSPDEAMRACKRAASDRLPDVPLAFITISRGTDTGDGGYTIHFDSRPPNGRRSSGFCIVSRVGTVQNLQFNPQR